MNRSLFEFARTTFVTVLVLSTLGCERQSPSPQTVTVGMLAPLTGAGSRFGESQRNGVQLAMDEMNMQGGVGGKTLKLVSEDTKTEPPTAVTAFTRLSERTDVLCIIGSAASLDVPAYLPLVDKARIPHVLPVAVLPKITEMGSRWTFRTALNDRIAATQMAEFAVRKLGASKIGLLIEDSAFGETGLHFAKHAENLGVAPLAIERFKRGDLDIKPQLTKMRSLGVTHVQFWGYYAEYAIVAKQMREVGFSAQLMGNQAPVNDKTIELGGAALEGAINICLFVPTDATPGKAKFVEQYRKRFGTMPDTWAAQAYDSMFLIADAVKRGGKDRSSLRDALAGTDGFSGITGQITFTSEGDAQFRGVSVVRVTNGQFVPFTE